MKGMSQLSDRHSILSFYTGYVVQAMVNTLTPLLYAMFNTSLGITLAEVGLIATVNFAVQIMTDLSSTLFVDRLGYRKSACLAHILSVMGLCGLSVLPSVLPSAYAGILLATVLMAIGGGLIEVVVSPMIEAMPTKDKARQMTFLHSFYCWGQAAVVLGSTLFFAVFGMEQWYFLPSLWAVLPLLNFFLLIKVPIYSLPAAQKNEEETPLFKSTSFWLFFLMMIAAGASEIAMSMWASLFAEVGLGVDKALGDLLGPCLFALLMGCGRVFSGSFLSGRLSLEKTLFFSAVGCSLCYAGAVFLENPIVSLLGCAFTGFFVSVMWPGTYSLGAVRLRGGTRMFALLALGGDIGCAVGSYLVGLVSDTVNAGGLPFLQSILPSSGTGIRAGLLFGLCFPLVMLLVSGFMWLQSTRSNRKGISGI